MGEWREMGGNGGKWGEMEENGGKWEKTGNHEIIKMENVGTTPKVGEKWGKVGEKREKMGGVETVELRQMGRNTQFSQSHFPHFFVGSKTFPTVPFIKIGSPHSPTEKWEFLPLADTHRHGG